MSSFESVAFNLTLADFELTSFKAWLAGMTFVGEAAIVAQIKVRRHMACLLGSALGLSAPDMIKFELAMKGLFRTDLVLGNHGERRFGLVEFEDAKENSIFRTGAGRYRYWSSRLEHGFGQIVDWAWVRSDHPNDTVLLNAFGGPVSISAFAIVCGRDASLHDDVDRKRFRHRRDNLKVEGQPAFVFTYDDMVRSMESSLTMSKTWSG